MEENTPDCTVDDALLEAMARFNMIDGEPLHQDACVLVNEIETELEDEKGHNKMVLIQTLNDLIPLVDSVSLDIL